MKKININIPKYTFFYFFECYSTSIRRRGNMNKKELVIDKFKIKKYMPVIEDLYYKCMIVVMISYLLCLLLVL